MVCFLETAPLVSMADLRQDKGKLPKERGVYGLFFATTPGFAETLGCLTREGRWLMYIGTAGANMGSRGTLRNRLGDYHLGGNERRSTVCQTLAALMPEVAGPAIAREERGKIKIHTSPQGAERLRQWMDENIVVCWATDPRPGDVAEGLVCQYSPPLNIDFSAHPFRDELRVLRSRRRDHARGAGP